MKVCISCARKHFKNKPIVASIKTIKEVEELIEKERRYSG